MEKGRTVLRLTALMSVFPLLFCYGNPAMQEGKMPPDATAEVKALIEELHSFDPVERRNAAQALGRMGEQAVPAIPALIRSLGDRARLAVRSARGETSPDSVAEAAMLALASLGAPAVEPLVDALQHDNPGVRIMAAEALGRIRDPRAVEPLIQILEREEDPLVQAAAVDALRKQEGSRVLEALLVAEASSSWVVRSLAKSAVEELRRPAPTGGGEPKVPERAPPVEKAPKEETTDEGMTDEDLTPWGVEAPAPAERAATEPVKETTHTVQRDETLYRIGLRYGVSWQTLMEYNELGDPTDLYVGQRLRIPAFSDGKAVQGRQSAAERAGGEPAGEEQTYIVQPGDTLYRIGLRYGVPWQTLMKYNNLHEPGALGAGRELKIPSWASGRASLSWDGTTTYTVQHGDILHDIGILFGTSWQDIAALNGLTDPDQIFVGQVLKIPTKPQAASP